MSTSHFGEFEDGKTYTSQRIATILNKSIDWVRKHFINSPSGPQGVKIGGIWFFSGEAIRIWIERRMHGDDDDTNE